MFPSGRKLGYFKRSQTYDNHDVFENQDLICVSLSSNEIHFVVVPHFTTVKVMLIVSIVDPLIVFNSFLPRPRYCKKEAWSGLATARQCCRR